ncbi:MAG: isoleucine--tRNA ligase [Candidatus Ancillula sp.]|jgi:isoleucyl-tRNA synthetase|nr:isoleucine--tRNA ligase [Candidatus Ancillula sp.]
MKYPVVSITNSQDKNVSFPSIEEAVLKYWKENNIFNESLEENKAGERGSNEFVFYDGPPFANGLPHYGHLLTGYVKDVIPRFYTMLGKRVDRRFGWDTHGLPAELEAQRELEIDKVEQIYELGIGKFNQACKKSVLKYTNQWQDYVNRQARWVDFENDYKTLDTKYMESVIWAFKQLYEKNLAYKGYKVLPYCWNDQTPLSNHELRMDDDVYKERQDNTVTLGIRINLEASPANVKKLFTDVSLEKLPMLAIWTTTAWTLPTNFLVAVGPEIDYALVRASSDELLDEFVIIAKSRIANYEKELLGNNDNSIEILREFKGKDIEGLCYHPIFDYFKQVKTLDYDLQNAYQVKTADYVGEDDGTGLVHIAPYGEDDMLVLNELGVIPPVPMTLGALLTAEISDYANMHVFDANKPIISDIKNATGSQSRIPDNFRAKMIRLQSLAHSYPHCWRCRKPLIYRPISSWFVKVTALKKRLLELNEDICWIPENVKHGQFGKWLEGARDWSISRNRFWGAPIPVWISDDPEYPRIDVYGSIAELEADFAECLTDNPNYPNGKINDLHRPNIDSLMRINPDDPTGNSMMRRIPDVFDCWFESGSMSFASVHYPFENKEWFEDHFPADFIVEYIGQTRGWFYTLHIMATALFDCNAFKNVMCHGIVLGSDGQKMSKSLRNYPDVQGVFDKHGSDAMRWFLMSSSILKGGNLSVKEDNIRDTVRQILLPFYSVYSFFKLYANSSNNSDGYNATEVLAYEVHRLPVMDRYILAKMRIFLEEITNSLKGFDISKATVLARDFIDVLTNWYIRTSRSRFWNEEKQAFDTLWTVLETLCRALAPLLPLTAEDIYLGLTGRKSVHLEAYPDIANNRNTSEIFISNQKLVIQIDAVREIISLVLSLRKMHNHRVRQPLSLLRIVVKNPDDVEEFKEVIANELNIKTVEFLPLATTNQADFGIEQQLNINARALGPRIGKRVQEVIQNIKHGKWKTIDGDIIVELLDGPIKLDEDEYTLITTTKSSGRDQEIASGILNESEGGFVVLSLTLDQRLINEGIARDIIRIVQEARKNAELDVADRIDLKLTLGEAQFLAANEFVDLICAETLAASRTFERSRNLDDVVVKLDVYKVPE